MKYSLWLAIMFAFCPTIVSQQVVEHHATVAESAKASSFEQKLDRRVRFDTAGRTMVASVVELALTYQLPTAIEYADHEATTRPLNLHFRNESVRKILEAITEQVPGYSVSFSSGIVDVFAAKGREDPSNLLNKVIKDFAVDQVDTDEADSQLFCGLAREAGRACAESFGMGQWGPLKITLQLGVATCKAFPSSIDALRLGNALPATGVCSSHNPYSKLSAYFSSSSSAIALVTLFWVGMPTKGSLPRPSGDYDAVFTRQPRTPWERG